MGMPRPFIAAVLLALLPAAGPTAKPDGPTLEQLGERLFFDVNLSANRTQACASCHNPEAGFSDTAETAAGRAVSIGDDGHSLGDRNAPSAAYAIHSPRFHRAENGEWTGGQFWDGRAHNLAAQAGGPPLNPIEMGLPDRPALAVRLRENPDYAAAFAALFGPGTLDDTDRAFDAATRALAAYEATEEFQPFDSKYDRFLRGEYQLTKQEELGRLLFFSAQFTNCNLCHQLNRSQIAERETFTNYQYRNIGVPVNGTARAVNGVAADFRDRGLGTTTGDPAQDGKFKTPTLRNVAVTGPYMHNGVFNDLRTVVLFYNKYNSKAAARQVNPETGAPWGPPEVAENIALEELETGPALEDNRVDALVAFLKTLTDARYEPLLAE